MEKNRRKIDTSSLFSTFRDLGNKADEALLRFGNMQEEILALFGFYNRLPQKKTAGMTINSDIKIETKKIVTT